MSSFLAYLVAACLSSAIGLAALGRGTRMIRRRRARQCVPCGHQLGVPTLGTGGTPSTGPTTELCTECGRHPDLDVDAVRVGTLLVTAGIVAQLAWLLVGASSWPAAALLLIETSIALLLFAVEPIGDRWRLRGLSPEVAAARATPRRTALRVLAAIVVLGSWSWVGWRAQRGAEYLRLLGTVRGSAPTCWPRVSNRSEWMVSILPPGLAEHARINGITARVNSYDNQPLPADVRDRVHHAWLVAPIEHAFELLDPAMIEEVSIERLNDAMLADGSPGPWPTLPALRILDLEGSSLSPEGIALLLPHMPRLEVVRANYLGPEDVASLRRAHPAITFESAVAIQTRRPPGAGPAGPAADGRSVPPAASPAPSSPSAARPG